MALKAAKVRLPKPPPDYGDLKVVIREMRRRHRNGEGVKSRDLMRGKELGVIRGLYDAMLKLFGNMNGALKAAKLKKEKRRTKNLG